MNASITTTPAPSGGIPRLLDLGRPARVGLLDEDVLAGLDRLQRPLVMHPVRQRDVDGVDPVVVEQRLVAPVRACDPVLARVRLRAGGVAARHRGDLDLRRRSLEQRVVDLRGGEQSQLHRESNPAAVERPPRERVVVGARQPADADRADALLAVERRDAAEEEGEERIEARELGGVRRRPSRRERGSTTASLRAAV